MTYCLGFAFYRNIRRVVLIRKTKPDWQRGKLNGVGGKIEVGECSNVAMAREFEEETGCKTFPTDWKHFSTMKFEAANTTVYCFAMRLASHQEVKTTTEEAVVVSSADDLPEDIIPNLAWLVPMALYELDRPYEQSFLPHTITH